MSNLISMDKKYKTRDGEDARILCTNNVDGEIWKVVAVVNGSVSLYTDSGRFNSNGVSGNDLIEVPEEKELWIEVFKSNGEVLSCSYETEEDMRDSIIDSFNSNSAKLYTLIATKKITYVEGETCL